MLSEATQVTLATLVAFGTFMVLLMYLSKYWLAKRFPWLDKLTSEGEYFAFLVVCVFFQACVLPSIAVYGALTTDMSSLEMWNGYVPADPTDPRFLVFTSITGYICKDFFFKDAIAEGDWSMFGHHVLSVSILLSLLSRGFDQAGYYAVGVVGLEFGSLFWNLKVFAQESGISWLETIVTHMFSVIMIASNVFALTLYGISIGSSDNPRVFLRKQWPLLSALVILVVARTNNAIMMNESIFRKLCCACLCPHVEKVAGDDSKPVVSTRTGRRFLTMLVVSLIYLTAVSTMYGLDISSVPNGSSASVPEREL